MYCVRWSFDLFSGISNTRSRIPIAFLCLVWLLGGAVRAEAPSDAFANPVLAKAELIIGPATEAAKIGINTALDYSVLSANISVEDYTEIHRETRGIVPNQTIVTTIRNHYRDTVDGKPVWETHVETLRPDSSVAKLPVSTETFKHGVGRVRWFCQAFDSRWRVIAKSELEVVPTRMRVRVEVAKFAGVKLRFPKRVALRLEATATEYRTCDLGGNLKPWSYELSTAPLQDTFVTFNGSNLLSDYLPTVSIGYNKPAK